jgi:hypothetical protein
MSVAAQMAHFILKCDALQICNTLEANIFMTLRLFMAETS